MSPGPPTNPTEGRLGAITGGRVFGRYVLDERIAIGGTADVFLAHPSVGSAPAPQVVVKRMLASLRDDPSSRHSFADEARLQARFAHPNIVRCFESGEVDGEPYLVMELVQGADLHRVLRLAQARKRNIPAPLACYIAREVLAALAVVHGGVDDEGMPLRIVHRDVSPSNIYLSSTGDVKLGDFGIARPSTAASSPPSNRAGGSLGTSIKGKFAYLAPEQVASEDVDHRADLFALANVLAEAMLSRPLFPGAGQLAVLLAIRDARTEALDGPSQIPLPLVHVLKRALAREPGRRYPDATQLAHALSPFAWHDGVHARREITLLVRWAREASVELRAVGQHPDQGMSPESRPMMGVGASSSPVEITNRAPVARPVPSIQLDSAILREDPVSERNAPKPASSGDSATMPFAPPPSNVRTTDGRVLSALTYAKLIELVVTGEIGADDEVDFMGTGFMPLVDVDELVRHLAPRSTVTRQVEGPGTPDWAGFAAERYDEDVGGAIEPGIATALSYVASRNASGVLMAQHGKRRKELYFSSGRVHHVASTEAGELIGEYLVARGLLERADLDFALAVLPRFNGHLGEALTGLGLLEAVTMFKAIQDQGRDKIVEIFSWSEGDLSFYGNAQPGKVEFPLDLHIGPIVEAGVASMLDDVRASARYRPWLDRRIRPTAASPSLRECGLSPRVERVLTIVHQPMVVRALLRQLSAEGISQQDAIRAVESARVARLLDWG